MSKKGLLALGLSLAFLSCTVHAANYGVTNDVWDLHQGAVVTAHSDLRTSATDPGMLGGADSFEPGDTIFADGKPDGYVHFLEWRTPAPVSVSHIKLYAGGDGAIYNNGREFGRFTLKIKSPGSSTFDTTVVTFVPTHPYATLAEPLLVLDTTFDAITNQDFRAEFQQINLRPEGFDGPRVVELDAFGPAVAPTITQQPVSTEVLAGLDAGFSATAAGTDPLTFTWMHEGTNVVLGDHFQSTDGRSLFIHHVRVEDAGKYTVHVSNGAGSADSNPATLTVDVDTNAPVVSIMSPVAGTVGSSSVTLQGTFSDNVGVTSARWEENGQPGGDLAVNAGTFLVPVTISAGETHLKVIAKDAAGNEGSAEVVVALSPTAPSADDLWDVSRGTVVTTSSGVYPEQNGPGLFGGGGFYAEPGDTVFTDDKPEGFTHYIEWKTLAPVTVSTVRLFAGGDGAIYNNEREFTSFTLKTKSPGSSTFDVTVFTFTPQHPYDMLDPVTSLILDTNFPAFTAQEFRGEFVQYNGHRGFDGPRVIEMDAFGPSSGGAPEIVNQPVSKDAVSGGSATFLVGATGAGPLSYQWRHEGTNIIEAARISGIHSWSLTMTGLTADDAGKYSVVVSNSLGETNSVDAILTVNVDTNAPIVTITSPTAGAQADAAFTLAGTIQDDYGVASARWEFNGQPTGDIRLTDGHFSVPGLAFQVGENHIKVIAKDLSGNESSAEVVATWTAPRVLVLEHPAPVQEGARLIVPVSLTSTGGVAGATFVVSYDTNYLADVQLDWADTTSGGLTSENLSGGRVRASFALPGTTLADGTAPIAQLNFRARSVPTNITTQLRLELVGMFADSGDQYTNNNFLQPTSALITKRKITGDVNANDRLDVGDASLILRLVSFLDPVRIWDRNSNDLNKNGDVDPGDVIKVLRAVVGLDPQPTVTAADASSKKTQSSLAQTTINVPPFNPAPLIALAADKSTAAPGDKVTVDVLISGQTKPISGASFRLEYPTDALRLDDSTARQLGGMIPSGSAAVWSLSSSADFAAQNGAISLAVSSANTWPTNNGTLARFVFTVQPGATVRYGWPVALKNLEVSRDGFTTDLLGDAAWTFIGHPPTQSSFAPAISFDNTGKAQLTLHGDIGATYRVDGSSDLINWTVLGAYYAADGTIAVQDSASAGATARFYRATLVP